MDREGEGTGFLPSDEGEVVNGAGYWMPKNCKDGQYTRGGGHHGQVRSLMAVHYMWEKVRCDWRMGRAKDLHGNIA